MVHAGSSPSRPGDLTRYNFDTNKITVCTNCQWYRRAEYGKSHVGATTIVNECEATKRTAPYPGSEAVGYAHRDRCEDVNNGHCHLFVEKLKDENPLLTWMKQASRRLGTLIPSFS